MGTELDTHNYYLHRLTLKLSIYKPILPLCNLMFVIINFKSSLSVCSTSTEWILSALQASDILKL